MPFGISLAVGAGSSLLGGILGKNSQQKAAQIQSQAAQQVGQQARADAATAGTGVTNATNSATSALNTAATGAKGTVADATTSANNTLAGVLQAQGSTLQPYITAGSTGLDMLTKALAPGGSLAGQFAQFDPNSVQNVQNDPGYQFRLDQGNQALQQSAAARGLLSSGTTLKDLTNYSQGLASTEYQNSFQRALDSFNTNLGVQQTNRNNTLGGITQLAGYGLPAAQTYSSDLSNFGNTASTNLLNSGYFSGNTDLSTATQGGNWGIGAQQYAGNALLDASHTAAQALTGSANAQAAATVGGTNSLVGGLNGAAQDANFYSLLKYLKPQTGGGQVNVPGASTVSIPVWGKTP